MEVKNCPKCNCPPNIEVRKSFLRYEYSVYCKNLGCELYFPQITLGFNKEKTARRAVDRWNESVNDFILKRGDD